MIALSQLLAKAKRNHTTLDTFPSALIPADSEAAYAIQHEILRDCDVQIGGWKIGAKSSTGPIQGAPLPADGLHASGARVARTAFAPLGLELEIAFRFNRTFEPSLEPYSEAEVHQSIGSMAATIEIVASRFAAWPKVDKLAQLADLQNHGALVVGEFVPYRDDFPFVEPTLVFSFDGGDTVEAAVAGGVMNPAGDPRRLLAWLVNHCAVMRGIAVTPEMVVTTGSYTGMFFPQREGTASGRIEGLPPVQVTLF